MKKLFLLAATLLALWGCNGARQTDSTEMLWLIVGSYSDAADEGVKVYSFCPHRGVAEYIGGLSGIANPSYLTPNASGTLVYAVGESEDTTSTVNAIAFDASTGQASLMDTRRTRGTAPCYVALSPDERFLLTANYMGGSISLLQLAAEGRFASEAHVIPFSGHGPVADRQEQPHLHCVAFTPDGSRLLANDLGLDQIHLFDYNPQAELSKILTSSGSIEIEPGSGPRHIVFNADGTRGYLINEISGAVTVLSLSAEPDVPGGAVGSIIPKQYIQADTVGAQGSGDIQLSPCGRHLYASNRLKADGLAIFSVDPATGLLARIGYQPTGRHPRNFAITPDGGYVLVACRDENTIEIYSRDPETGLLADTGGRIETPKPVCLKFITQK